MVATIRVLYGLTRSIVAYFHFLSLESYYGAKSEGVWHGALAKSLGINGVVQPFVLMALLSGQSPTGEMLQSYWDPKKNQAKAIHASSPCNEEANSDAKNSRKYSVRARNPGLDLTLNVPKSYSVFMAAAPDEIQRKLEAILLHAARRTVTILERNIPLTRRGYGGVRQEMASIAAALYLHKFNRNQDIHAHVHCVIPNICLTGDGKYLTINSHLLHKWVPCLGRVFRCELAKELQLQLGVKLRIPVRKDGKKESWFEIEGIPQKLIEHWSSRRQEILEHLSGGEYSLGVASAKARQQATLDTRQAKSQDVDYPTLMAEKKLEAERFGLTEEKVMELLHQTEPTPLEQVYDKALQESLEEITQQNAHFTARDIVQQVCEKTQHLGISGEQILQRVFRDLEQSPKIVRLSDVDSERHYTTIEMWQLEEKLLADVRQLQNRQGAVVTEKQIAKTLASYATLSEEQRTAIKELLSDDRGIRVLSGNAGAGKSFALNVVREVFERAGYQVIGGAVSGAAKEELARQSGIPSRTVASYLYHWEKTPAQKLKARAKHELKMLARAAQKRPTYSLDQMELDKKTVLILDEAGMLATADLERLISHVVASGATLILVGDPLQLPPIGAGGPLERIARIVGDAKLTENRRQQDPADRQAVADLREEKVEQSLQNYAQRDRISIGEDRQETIEILVDAWVQQGGSQNPIDHIVLTQTRAEAAYINKRCQRERLLQAPLKPMINAKLGDERFYAGDRVMFHTPLRKYGIENGYRGMVLSVDPIRRTVKVRLDQKPSPANKARGHKQIVKLPLRSLKEGDIQLGYSATSHKLQGQSIANAYLLLGGMTTREMAYVQITRAKETTRLFIDRPHAGKDLSDLVAAVKRSQAKNLAHDIALPAQKTAIDRQPQASSAPEQKMDSPKPSLNPDSSSQNLGH